MLIHRRRCTDNEGKAGDGRSSPARVPVRPGGVVLERVLLQGVAGKLILGGRPIGAVLFQG